MRANTLKTYFDANRACLREGSYRPPSSGLQQSQEPLIDPKSQISSDSIIGDSTKIGERTSIKKSIIGSHCIIGRNAKISGSVLLDHVVVKDGAKVENSLLSRHTNVGDRCSVKETETATGVTLTAGGDYKNEKVEQFDSDEDGNE